MNAFAEWLIQDGIIMLDNVNDHKQGASSRQNMQGIKMHQTRMECNIYIGVYIYIYISQSCEVASPCIQTELVAVIPWTCV